MWSEVVENLAANVEPSVRRISPRTPVASTIAYNFSSVSGHTEPAIVASVENALAAASTECGTSDDPRPPMSHFRLEAREASMRARRDNYTSSVDFMEQNWIVFVDKPLERLLSGWTSTLTMLHAITSLNSMVTDNTSFARWMEIWASSRTDPAEKSQSGISNSASKSKDLALNLGMCDGLISRCFTGMDETQRGQITTSIAGYWLALTRHAGNLIRAESCYGDEMVLLELIRAISRYSWLEPRHYFESAGIGHPIVFPIVTFLMKDHAIRKGVLKLNPTPATLPTLLQLYLASRQPLQRFVVRKGKANAAETITVNNYATEVATAVTFITALADQYVHKRGDPEVFKNLASFQQDLANIKLAEHPPLPHILKYSALAVGHQFTLINARCLEYGERLWNSCTIVPSFLFLFCAFQGLEDFKGSTVIDAVCTHLLRQGSKGVFTDGKPKKKFLKNFNLVIMDIELSSVRLSGRVN